MNERVRPVDRAMGEDHPDKVAIRSLWTNKVREVAEHNPNSSVPWYLTLSGADGRDIQQIIEAGLISLTEVNGIAENDKRRIVAVENNNQAITRLQKKFVGLTIREADFRSLLHGEGIFAWPGNEDFEFCRAHIVNIDLNAPLKALMIEGQIIFPVLEWVKKLCHIHSRPPKMNWTLCLTLHGEVVWPEDVNNYARMFIQENFNREPIFAESCRQFLGQALFEILVQDDGPAFTDLERSDQQKLIMVIVPKIITRLVHNEGWKVLTEHNLSYGGGERAPMVTWIVEFAWDGNAAATPDNVYKESLRNIFYNIGEVTADGEILRLL